MYIGYGIDEDAIDVEVGGDVDAAIDGVGHGLCVGVVVHCPRDAGGVVGVDVPRDARRVGGD